MANTCGVKFKSLEYSGFGFSLSQGLSKILFTKSGPAQIIYGGNLRVYWQCRNIENGVRNEA
jgi:hypothetical protein